MLNQWSIGRRLGVAFSLILLVLLISTSIGVIQLREVGNAANNTMADALKTERLVSDWSRNIFGAIRRTLAIARSNDPALIEFFKQDTEETTRNSTELQKTVESLMHTDEEKRLFAEIGEARTAFISDRNAVSSLKKEGKTEEALTYLDSKFIPSAKLYQERVARLLKYQRDEIDRGTRFIDESYQSGLKLLILFAVIALTLSAVVGFVLTRSITTPLSQAVLVTQSVSEGNLANEIVVNGADEVAQLMMALRNMQATLTSVIGNVRNGSDGVAIASAEIAQGNNDLSARTEQQAAAIEETNASMNELSDTVNQNADAARQANQLATSASSVAEHGGEVVARVVNTMNDINESSRRIADIISVIDGIAFQTNILALNAAVEAARAGEQGRGFAVVASEVRALAGRSAEAAKEIKALITASVEKVEQGTTLVDQAGSTMSEVVSSIRRVTDIMGEISAASDEQSLGVSQISEAIGSMDQTTQQNAALVEEMAAAATSLKVQAQELVQSVSVFKLANIQSTPSDKQATRERLVNLKSTVSKSSSVIPVRNRKEVPSMPAEAVAAIPSSPKEAADGWETF